MKLRVLGQEPHSVISKVAKLLAVITLFGGVFLLVDRNNKHSESTLRLGYSFFGSISEIDPKEIQSIYQSNIIENLYSRLVEYDNAGQIICMLCSSFKIDGDKIIFYFDGSTKTIDKNPIGAKDAKLSLERLIATQTNTHGSLQYFLKDNGIGIKDDLLVLNVVKEAWAPFVLTLLTSMDFSIVPYGSLKDEKIVDYRNTSGPYYVSSSDDSGNVVIKANPFHSLYSEKMPQTVNFVPLHAGDAQNAFAAKKIDMIDATYFAYEDDISSIMQDLPKEKLHKTLNIGLTTLVFSNRIFKATTAAERISAAVAIEEVYNRKARKLYGAVKTDQFFQSFGQGFISPEQKKVLADRKLKRDFAGEQKFIFGVTSKYKAWFDQNDFPANVVLKFYETYPGFLPEENRPDVYILNTDSSFDEDISALSYQFSQGTFTFPKKEGAMWLQSYMDIPSREGRIAKLQDFHFEMLKEVKVYPLSAKPYVTICDEKWGLNFPKLYAGTPLWKVWIK
jgi:hypothetical protein